MKFDRRAERLFQRWIEFNETAEPSAKRHAFGSAAHFFCNERFKLMKVSMGRVFWALVVHALGSSFALARLPKAPGDPEDKECDDD